MIPPKISAPFNPFNLTPSDVGAGWYLLPKGEPLKAGDEFWWPGIGWVDYDCRPSLFCGMGRIGDRFHLPTRDYVHTYPWRRKCPETGGGAGSPAGSSAVLTQKICPDAPESPRIAGNGQSVDSLKPKSWTVAAESGVWWVTDENYKEVEPTYENALLMAAALDLLAVVQGLLACEDAGMDPDWKLIEQAKAAIEKAKGGKP